MQERTILLRCLLCRCDRSLLPGALQLQLCADCFSGRGTARRRLRQRLCCHSTRVPPGRMTLELMNANAKEPAVALAQSILSDEAVRELAKQAGVSFSSNQSEVAEFRSRLDMAQTSARLLLVNYKDTDKKLSAAVANAVANMLVAWIRPSSQLRRLLPPGQVAPSAKPAFAKSRVRGPCIRSPTSYVS